MSQWWKEVDTQFQQEQHRYNQPVPSRAFIAQYLEKKATPLVYQVLCRAFCLTSEEEQEALRWRLLAMVRDGQLRTNRKGAFAVIKPEDVIVGVVQGHRDGYGFLIPDDASADIFLSIRQMRSVFHGDRVAVRLDSSYRKGRRAGVIVNVLEHNTTRLVGRYYEKDNITFVTPESPKITHDIMIQPGALRPAPGQYVVVKIITQPQRHHPAQAELIEILGDHLSAGLEVDVALRTYEIPHVWPESVQHDCKDLKACVSEQDKKGRVDLRALPLVTIDGEQARDFDDAVYCTAKPSGGWRLYVAIADVAHYVKPDSVLDEQAQCRGNSVYFPGSVIPMLPEVLSNGLCSLNPQVDRLALVCEMTISANGRLSGYRFYRGLIRSQARLTYTEVGQFFLDPSQTLITHDLQEPLQNLHALYQCLHHARMQRGGIDFETTETAIEFNENRKIKRIIPVQRNDAHRAIEECMLCANVAAARFLNKAQLPTLYRIHEIPKSTKLTSLKQFLSVLGLSLQGGDKPKPQHYQALLAQAKQRPDFAVIQTMLLRSMNQAVYSPESGGHFGLGFTHYLHFTSPIRRYPDLLTHRAIIFSLEQQGTDFDYGMADMVRLGEHCSMTERRADEATRDVTNWLKCEYMQQHLGQHFSGVISAVTDFGLFVALDTVFVEGLVHISELPDDYYQFDPARQCLTGRRTGKRMSLGDRLDIVVARVDLDDRKMDFSLAEHHSPSGKRRKRKMMTKGKKALDKKKSPVEPTKKVKNRRKS